MHTTLRLYLRSLVLEVPEYLSSFIPVFTFEETMQHCMFTYIDLLQEEFLSLEYSSACDDPDCIAEW